MACRVGVMDSKDSIISVDWSLVYVTRTGKLVVLERGTGEPMLFNETTRAFLNAADGRSLTAAVALLERRYGAPADCLQHDLRSLLAEMKRHGVIAYDCL